MTASDAAGAEKSKSYLLEKQRMVVDDSTGVVLFICTVDLILSSV